MHGSRLNHDRRRVAANRIVLSFLMAMLTPLVLSASAAGQSGGIMPCPLPGGKPVANTTGLTLAVDSTWIAASGYRPITVVITSTAPMTADRTLTLRFIAEGSSMFGRFVEDPSFRFEVNQQLDIPAGATIARARISLPQHHPIGQLKLDVYEDGQHLKALSSENVFVTPENGNNAANGASSSWSHANPGVRREQNNWIADERQFDGRG